MQILFSVVYINTIENNYLSGIHKQMTVIFVALRLSSSLNTESKYDMLTRRGVYKLNAFI